MTEQTKQIQESIKRSVAHIAREHGVKQDAIWSEMYLLSLKQLTLEK